MRKIINSVYSHKRTFYYSILTVISVLTLLILLSAGKSNNDELSFLDVNLNLIKTEAAIAYDKKDYREAARKYITILHHKPNDVAIFYDLASCYAHLNKPELAAKAIHYALDAGLNDIHLLYSDSVWNSIRNHKDFKSLLDEVSVIKKERGESFFAECKVLIRGRLRQPDNFDSTKTYPLLILLHGNGANAESYMSLRDRMGATNFFVAAPQGPYPRKLLESNKPSYSWFFLTRNKELWKEADPMVITYILNVVDEIKGKYKISGVYLLGHSQGGALAYMTGIKNPDKVNGIICYGAPNPKEFINKADLRLTSTKLPIFISHGWSDQAVLFDEAQETKNLLKDYGFNVTFKPFQGGHWLEINTLIEAKNWIEEIEMKNNQYSK